MRGYYKQLKMYNAAMLIMSVDFFEEVAFNSINTRVVRYTANSLGV